jgi:hypothetical protein
VKTIWPPASPIAKTVGATLLCGVWAAATTTTPPMIAPA